MTEQRAIRLGRPRPGVRPGAGAAIGAALRGIPVVLAWLISATTALAASPSPGAAGDPRSPGQGPGLVGDPLFAVLAVVGLGLASVLVTLGWVRLTTRRGA